MDSFVTSTTDPAVSFISEVKVSLPEGMVGGGGEMGPFFFFLHMILTHTREGQDDN